MLEGGRFRRAIGAAALAAVVLAAEGSALATAATTKPTISHFSPLSVKTLATVTIDGTNFTGVKTVKVGASVAKFKVASKTKITATVPSNAKSGKVTVTTAAGSVTSTVKLTVLPAAPATTTTPATTTAPSSSTVIGNPTMGESLFNTTCGVCHTLAAAGSQGTIGPNLNTLAPLSETTIIEQITNGGSALMGAAAAKYSTQMVGYKGVYTTAQIDDIAAFVYNSTHPAG